MNLEVVLVPDPERYRVWYAKTRRPAPSLAVIHRKANRCIPYKHANITCFDDVRDWANEISQDVRDCYGPYFFCLKIRETGKGKCFMEYEMPHGDMLLEDRLWIPIDMYEAFYVDVT